MPVKPLYIWKQAPFLRLVIPFIAGITAAWYLQLPVKAGWLLLACGLSGYILFNLRSTYLQFRYGWWNGIFINLLFFAAGALLTWYRDPLHQRCGIDHYFHNGSSVITAIDEPLSEKENTFKALAAAQALMTGDSIKPVKENIIIYFQKDSIARKLGYGDMLVFNRPLQPIKNSGNPGAFDYRRYAAFRDIHYQVYLRSGDYRVLSTKKENHFKKLLIAVRQKILNIITTYIPGEKEAGLAEALLIGYKDDLDKSLVQSYTNTGVVHIIAISGLHLGLIYGLLLLLLRSLPQKKAVKWLRPLFVMCGLWLFALLTGGGPSIMRSAVMFSFIVAGQAFSQRVSVYNTLAASAFFLLFVNPFWLWDAGFQLSYTAVLSIVIFMKPVFNWFCFRNKIVDAVWKLTAITIAAQVLTTPLSIYQFHQFPNYFLLTNLVAVPLSCLILAGEILLCITTVFPPLAAVAGKTIEWLIRLLNDFIGYMEHLPFAQWQGLQLSIPQLILLYGFAAAMACWLLEKRKSLVPAGLACIFGFILLRSVSFINANRQEQLVVYNVPNHLAMDFISGRNHYFYSDSGLAQNEYLSNFYLKPSRILNRTMPAAGLSSLTAFPGGFYFGNKKIILIGGPCNYEQLRETIPADLVLITGNPPLHLPALTKAIDAKQVVFDSSNPAWKLRQWMAEGEKLGLNCFSVADKGAFEMRLN